VSKEKKNGRLENNADEAKGKPKPEASSPKNARGNGIGRNKPE
jgi:hypothetical protein